MTATDPTNDPSTKHSVRLEEEERLAGLPEETGQGDPSSG